MTGLHATVAVLCVYRLTLVVTADEITAPWRDRLVRWLNGRKHGGPPELAVTEGEALSAALAEVDALTASYEAKVAMNPHRVAFLLTCWWCASPYVAPPVIAATLAWGGTVGWWLACGTLAASGATGALASKAAP